jgi:hypothetical protein
MSTKQKKGGSKMEQGSRLGWGITIGFMAGLALSMLYQNVICPDIYAGLPDEVSTSQMERIASDCVKFGIAMGVLGWLFLPVMFRGNSEVTKSDWFNFR